MKERVQFVRVDDTGLLIVRLDGGGAAEKIVEGMPMEGVCRALRDLATSLERGAATRKAERLAATPCTCKPHQTYHQPPCPHFDIENRNPQPRARALPAQVTDKPC